MPDRLLSVARATFAPESARRVLEEVAQSSSLSRAVLENSSETFVRNLAELLVVCPPMEDSLRRHPEWIAWLKGRVEGTQAECDELDAFHDDAGRAWVSSSDSAVGPLDQLRAFKRREYLEITYRDISGLCSVEQIIQRLSSLADRIIGWTLLYCWASMAERRPAALKHAETTEGFATFALGKLGGCELNYSSDVDLVFFRRPSEEPEELRFFTRLGERLVQALSEPGPDGFLYRVDMRLRPYGDAGPLVPSLASLVSYYESWGEAWERQALIKARFVSGSEDLGRRFGDFVTRFTFARQMDDSSLEEIKRVKYRSEKEYALPPDRVNLKQGPGGIRDIEFYVQYLQLIAGCAHPAVCTGSTLEAIHQLAAVKVLLEGEESELSLAYQFLRIVEHRLQLRTLTPQAILPDDQAELALLARGLGFGCAPADSVTAFRAVLQRHRTRVRSILERIYLAPGYLRLTEEEEEFAQLLTERTPRQRAGELLSHYGFQDRDKAWQNIRLMALGPAGSMLPQGERRAFLGIVFSLLEVLRDSLDPDQALHHLESFAAASGNRVSFLRALASRRQHLARLINLLALSKLCHQILTRHPEYFDTVARGVHLREGRHWYDMYSEIHARLGSPGAGEKAEEIVRRFRQRELVRIAYRDLAGLADALELSAELAELADACVLATVDLVQIATGYPKGLNALMVLALGKAGSRQMHYASDLDLMFLYEDPDLEASSEIRAQFQRAQDNRAERILELLAGVTAEGVAYSVDLRLRPEGASGLLARSWSSFLDYAHQYMKPWERMALVRSRVLGAAGQVSERWSAVLADVVYGFAWNEEPLQEIRHLKRRIEKEKNRESRINLDFKYGKGGIVDLEFLVELLQILHGKDNPSVRTPGVVEALQAFQQAGVISAGELAQLLAAHRFQRQVENHYQLMEEWASREISRESPQLNRLARSLGFSAGTRAQNQKQFLAAWDDHAQTVRRLVEKYFYGS